MAAFCGVFLVLRSVHVMIALFQILFVWLPANFANLIGAHILITVGSGHWKYAAFQEPRHSLVITCVQSFGATCDPVHVIAPFVSYLCL